MLRSELNVGHNASVAVPLPPLTVDIARPDMQSINLSIEGGSIKLHHNMQKIGCVSTMLSTGGGSRQLGDLRQGLHVYEGGTMLLQEHTVDGQNLWSPMFLSIYYNTDKEVRPAGSAWVHVGELLKAACASESLKVGGYLYASDGKSPITAVQVEITPERSSASTVRQWCNNEGKKVYNSLMNRTFDPSQITKELSQFAADRTSALNARFGAISGSFDKTMSLHSVNMIQDTGALVVQGCPLQRELFIETYHRHEDIALKLALKTTQLMVLAMSEYAVWSSGKETINLQTIQEILDTQENNMTLSQATKMHECVTDALTRLQDNIYTPDEHFDVKTNGNLSQDLGKVGEKEDLAGGLNYVHYEKMVQEYCRMQTECAALLKQKSQTGSAFGGQDKIEELDRGMTKIRNKIWGLYGDCEDEAAGITMQYRIMRDYPEMVFEPIKPYMSKQILSSPKDDGGLKARIWSRVPKFISNALQRHTQGGVAKGETGISLSADTIAEGVTREIVNGICVANGASLQQSMARLRESLDKGKLPMREEFESNSKFVQAMCGDKLGGHACPFQIERGPERELINDGRVVATSYVATIWKGEVLEATKPCTQNLNSKFVRPAKNVDVNISMGERTLDMKAVPLNMAMNTIAQAFQIKINEHLNQKKAGLCCAIPLDISAASSFYATFSSFGGDFCVSAELRDEDTGKITSIHTKNMQHVLDKRPENVRYVGAKLAWDLEYGAESPKTEVLCVKFKPSRREMDIISMACKEVGEMHRMSKEQFAAIMQMGIRLDCGWNADTYTSMRPKTQDCAAKMPLQILVRTLEGCLSAENVMKCMTETQVKQHKESVVCHHLSNALDMDCSGASFRWINQDFGVVDNIMVELGDAVK